MISLSHILILLGCLYLDNIKSSRWNILSLGYFLGNNFNWERSMTDSEKQMKNAIENLEILSV